MNSQTPPLPSNKYCIVEVKSLPCFLPVEEGSNYCETHTALFKQYKAEECTGLVVDCRNHYDFHFIDRGNGKLDQLRVEDLPTPSLPTALAKYRFDG